LVDLDLELEVEEEEEVEELVVGGRLSGV